MVRIAGDIREMLTAIEAEARLTQSQTGRKQLDPRVMAVMGQVPREEFVPLQMKLHAYDNGPLPIGHGQTISQPYIVALMTDLMRLKREAKVLEIGTGCGYQTAVLASLADRVYTVEVVAELARAARRRLQQMSYTNIEFHIGNGYAGWPEYAPYDAIIVTAAATHVPPQLIKQLCPGGRLVIPVGFPYAPQTLTVVEKDAAGKVSSTDIIGVVFVPLIA